MSVGGFFKRLGQKIVPIGKTLYLGGKSVLHNINKIGNKVMPYTDIAVGLASPYLSTNPYGVGALAGYAGLKGGLALTNRLEKLIEDGESLVEPISRIGSDIKNSGLIRGVDNNYMEIVDTSKKALITGKALKKLGQDGVALYRKQQGSSGSGGERMNASNNPLYRNSGDIGSTQRQNNLFAIEMGDNTQQQRERVRREPTIELLN